MNGTFDGRTEAALRSFQADEGIRVTGDGRVALRQGPGRGNTGFHEIPANYASGRRLQSDSQLGQARSPGCVRQSTSDAIYVWNWAPVGTKVVVLP